jgi:hypothetical protein
MERAVALKKLQKVLGNKLGYRINANAPTPEEREIAKVQLQEAVCKSIELKEKRDARYKQILAGDAEYQNLHAAHKTASEHVDKLRSLSRHYKITVGTDEGLFFRQRAEGDSWEEIIKKVHDAVP